MANELCAITLIGLAIDLVMDDFLLEILIRIYVHISYIRLLAFEEMI